MDEEADTDAVRLREILESTGLKQHVTAPTHISGHTLDLVNAYNNTFKSVLDHYAPAITETVVKRPTVPWFNDRVKSAKKEKRRAERK